MTSIAVVGAGLAGLVVARNLAREHDVTVFEKSRGVGGRIATRYAGDLEFDHGAQFFSAKSAAFRSFLLPMIEQDVVASWSARFAELKRSRITATRQWDDEFPHYVGTPRMNALAKWLARDIDVRLLTTVSRLAQRSDGWLLVASDERELGRFDWVVSTAPAPQTAALLTTHSSVWARDFGTRMRGCYALMLAFDRQLEMPFDAALVRDADISWVSVNSSKPGRAGPVCVVAHSTNAWADAHLEDDIEDAAAHLRREFRDITGIDADSSVYSRLHRWRYANIAPQAGPDFYIDPACRIAACGDWFIRGRIEAAFTSARLLSASLENHL